MYIIEVFSLETRAWRICYQTPWPNDAFDRWWRLRNDGFAPRVRKVNQHGGNK